MEANCSRISFLGQIHMIDVILYIQSNLGCSRTDIYTGIARGDKMGMKIDMLISEGIAEDTSPESQRSTLRLTPLRESVASHLMSIESLLQSRV